jgi:hypothetical protein
VGFDYSASTHVLLKFSKHRLKNEFEIPLMTDLGQFSGDNDDRNKRDGAKSMVHYFE